MALEALSSNEFLNCIIYDTISATPFSHYESMNMEQRNNITTTTTNNNNNYNVNYNVNYGNNNSQEFLAGVTPSVRATKSTGKRQAAVAVVGAGSGGVVGRRLPEMNVTAVQGRKKRRRKARVCKNKEEAETQRMTHIAVERNRRKQMNEHLAVLRSLMPESYVQRGDQASIVGGAIEFVKELEHLLQSLEAQKHKSLQKDEKGTKFVEQSNNCHNHNDELEKAKQEIEAVVVEEEEKDDENNNDEKMVMMRKMPFSEFFVYPQYTWCMDQNEKTKSKYCNNLTSRSKNGGIADIEVTLIETHASLRILTRKSKKQVISLMGGFHALHLTILHLNITTLDPLVLYSISAKVEEGCQLSSVDDIAGAVHHMLRIIEEEAVLMN